MKLSGLHRWSKLCFVFPLLVCISKCIFSQEWKQIPQPVSHCILTGIIRHNNILYSAAGFEGLYRSADNGSTWSKIQNTIPDFGAISLASTGKHLFVGTTYSGFFRFDDTDNSFTKCDTSLNSGNFSVHTLVNVDNTIIADGWGSIFVGDADSMIWHPVITDSKDFSMEVYSAYKNDSILLMGTNHGELLLSRDKGRTAKIITRFKDIFTLFSDHIVSITMSGDVLIASVGTEGIFRSKDMGKTWERIDKENKLGSQALGSKTIDGIMYLGTNTGIFRSLDNSNTWEEMEYSGSTISAFYHDIQTKTLYACSEGCKIYRYELPELNIVQETIQNSVITVYPNPAFSTVTLNFSQHLQQAKAEVYSVYGSRLAEYTFTGSSAQLDVSTLSSGEYLIRISSPTKETIMSRITVIR